MSLKKSLLNNITRKDFLGGIRVSNLMFRVFSTSAIVLLALASIFGMVALVVLPVLVVLPLGILFILKLHFARLRQGESGTTSPSTMKPMQPANFTPSSYALSSRLEPLPPSDLD